MARPALIFAIERSLHWREVHERCAGQMFFQCATQGRSPPNWNLYDYCVRQATRSGA